VRERRKQFRLWRSAENVICRVLCLGRGANQKFEIVAKLVE
jgi:hypothetical protein